MDSITGSLPSSLVLLYILLRQSNHRYVHLIGLDIGADSNLGILRAQPGHVLHLPRIEGLPLKMLIRWY
jgi:hypothetical protein